MDENQLDLRTKITTAIICSLVFVLVYNFSAWYASNLNFVPSFVFSFDKYLPFISLSILPYLTSGLFFCTIFFFCKTKDELNTLKKRLLFIILIAGIIFLLFPLKHSYTKPEIANPILKFLFHFLETVDSPYNQSPSLHVAFAFVFWTIFRNFKARWRSFIAFWLILLALATLTTFQHHAIDLFAGSILAHFSFIIFPVEKNNFHFRNFHVANYYFLAAWIFAVLALLLNEFYNPTWLLLLWTSLVFFLVGYHYQKDNVHFLKDKEGTIPFYKKIVYLPYFMLYWSFWKFLRKNKTPIAVLPKLYISSLLDAKALTDFDINVQTYIYDFSAELEELQAIKENSNYFCVPLLDISSFDVEQIKKIVREISQNYKELSPNGKILIHCTMGFTRSSIIAILVVKKILSLPLHEAIQTIKKSNKNAVIHTYLQDFLTTIDI